MGKHTGEHECGKPSFQCPATKTQAHVHALQNFVFITSRGYILQNTTKQLAIHKMPCDEGGLKQQV